MKSTFFSKSIIRKQIPPALILFWVACINMNANSLSDNSLFSDSLYFTSVEAIDAIYQNTDTLSNGLDVISYAEGEDLGILFRGNDFHIEGTYGTDYLEKVTVSLLHLSYAGVLIRSHTESIVDTTQQIGEVDGVIDYMFTIPEDFNLSSNFPRSTFRIETKATYLLPDGLEFLQSAQCLILDSAELLQGISLSAYTLEIDTGEQASLQVIYEPENAYHKTVEWESTDPTIIAVDEGVVTAIDTGSAYVKVRSVNNAYSDSCFVRANIPSLASTNNTTNFSDARIFPNPSNGTLSFLGIEQGVYTLTVMNTQGLIISSSEIFLEESKSIDMSGLANGSYILLLKNKEHTARLRLTVIH